MKVHLQQEIHARWQRNRRSVGKHHRLTADGPAAQASRVALTGDETDGHAPAETGLAVRPVLRGEASTLDVSEERMMRSRPRGGTQLDCANPLVLGQLRRYHEVAIDVVS